jgi:hypothetical protein
MLVYNTTDSEWSSPPAEEIKQKQELPKLPPDISEKLQKLELTITPEVFQRIQEAWQEANFQSDLSAILTSPSETSRFEQQWLKGYWQEVTLKDGSKVNFADIAKMGSKEQEAVIEQVEWAKTRLKLTSYLTQVANQRKTTELEWAQVANQRLRDAEERAKDLDSRLQSSTDQIRSLSSLPPGIEQKALEEAKRNPPPQLKGIPPEQYGEYTNLILAEYTITNRVDIASKLSEEDKKKFGEALKSAGNVLGYKIEEFSKLTSTLVLGENRGKVESIGKDLIKNGYSENVVWNPRDRTMIFVNEKWEKRIIDTASIPPTQRIQDGALELSMALPEKKNNPYTKVRESQEQDIIKSLDKWSRLPLTGWNEVQSSPTTLWKLQKSITVLESNTASLQERLRKEEWDAKNAGIQGETEETKAIKTIISSIRDLRNELIQQWEQWADISQKELQEEGSNSPEVSLNIGKENMRELSSMGIGTFRNMEEVSAFFSVLHDPTLGNNFSNRESTNTYLLNNKLTTEQLQSIFARVVDIYAGLTGNNDIKNLPKEKQYITIRGQDENGKTRLENALNIERVKQDGRTLNASDFRRVLSLSESVPSATK